MIYAKEKDYTLFQGKMQDVLDTLEENSIDSIVCDPPYHLTSIQERFGKENSKEAQYGKDGSFQRLSKGFMGKTWDGGDTAFQPDTWKHCYRVLKDGGYLLAFGGSRTFHRIACAIEDAGFEIRDTIMWLYGSGFPKSMNIGLAIDKKNGVESKVVGEYNPHRDGSIRKYIDNSKFSNLAGTEKKYIEGGLKDLKEPTLEIAKQWNGWGTCLKPAYEPIIVARKPFKGSLVDNVIENGVGGINIDECRVGDEYIKGGTAPDLRDVGKKSKEVIGISKLSFGQVRNAKRVEYKGHNGRFPANVILTYDETDFDEVCGGMPDTKSNIEIPNQKHTFKGNKDAFQYGYKMRYGSGFNDEGNASRYFYCAKASKKDRDEGLDMFENVKKPEYCLQYHEGKQRNEDVFPKNIHPTVKPIELMQYLVRLVTPKNATILDCFMGSGSTGKAVMFENRERNANYHFIGIEMTEEYLPICKARIDYALNKYEYDFQKQLKEEKDKGQLSIFDFM